MPDALVAAVVRQLARFALVHHRKDAVRAYQWGRQTEADVVRMVQSYFDGLGYITWLTQPYPGAGKDKKMDLWAEPPLHAAGDTNWLIEAKALIDGADNRCGRDRFQSKREILKDFDHCLAWCPPSDRWAVVWAVFSRDAHPISNGPNSPTLRLGDLLREVPLTHSGVERKAAATLDVEPLADHNGFRYCHVLVWGPR